MKNRIITLVFALILFGIGYSFSKIQPAAEPDSLTITQSEQMKQSGPLSDTLTITLKNKALIKELYTDLLAVPEASKEPTSCPGDTGGISYHLTFMQGNQAILQADAGASGCRFIKLSNGKVLRAIWKNGDQFWSLFNQTLGYRATTSWQVSPTFKIPYTSNDGSQGEYLLIGKEGKLGFIIGSGKKGEAKLSPIIAGKLSKHMWFFWGQDLPKTPFKVVGINKETGKEANILIDNNGNPVSEYKSMAGPYLGANAITASDMSFPTPGLWRLDVYFENEFFRSVVVEVQ